jgi:hypothetical protein
VNIGDVWALGEARDVDGLQVLARFFDWRRDRLMLLAKGSLGFAASLVIGLGLALLRNEVVIPTTTLAAALAGLSLIVGFGVEVLAREVPKLQREFLLAVRLYEVIHRTLWP